MSVASHREHVRLVISLSLLLASVGLLSTPSIVSAQPDIGDAEAVPHLETRGEHAYSAYLDSYNHKSFAISPGGRWGWSADEISDEAAKQIAIERCQKHSPYRCVTYALGNSVVLDESEWAKLWRPVASSNGKEEIITGTSLGNRFPNLVLKDMDGNQFEISSLQGRVVVLHLWGSWCPSCISELPQLQKLNQAVEAELDGKVEIVMMQVRESFSKCCRWAERNNFDDLPVYDSGISSAEDQSLTLSSGETINDRQIARVFPSTYVLGKQGTVLFAHNGPIDRWLQYLPFLRDVASLS